MKLIPSWREKRARFNDIIQKYSNKIFACEQRKEIFFFLFRFISYAYFLKLLDKKCQSTTNH